jgi:RNA polymerase sigma factor (sigma-70 family)
MEASSPIVAHAGRSARVSALALFGDERLARLVGGGSERAFATLYQRYHQPLYRYCRSIVRSEFDAQDALQSTFASALAALRRGQRDAPVRPWLFRIAHNEAISVVRRRRAADQASGGNLEGFAPSAEDQFAERDRLSMLLADLRELPERQRAALLMRELSGLSHEEIARSLGASVASAKQAIFEARQGLLEFAEGRAMACEDVRRAISDGDRRVLRGRRVRAHMRGCSSCAAFASAIEARRSELRALVPPIAPVAAAGVLARATGVGSLHGAASSSGAGTSFAAVTTSKLAGASFVTKALVGTAIVVTASGGVAGVIVHDSHRAIAYSQRATSRPAAVNPSRLAIPRSPAQRAGSTARTPSGKVRQHRGRSSVRTGGGSAARGRATHAAVLPANAHAHPRAGVFESGPRSVAAGSAAKRMRGRAHGNRGAANHGNRGAASRARAHRGADKPGGASVASPKRGPTSRQAPGARGERHDAAAGSPSRPINASGQHGARSSGLPAFPRGPGGGGQKPSPSKSPK